MKCFYLSGEVYNLLATARICVPLATRTCFFFLAVWIKLLFILFETVVLLYDFEDCNV